MDFSTTEEQNTLRDLAREILANEVTPERLKAAEATAERSDEALWKTLAEASLLGVAVPEAQGGMGFGVAELCVLLEEVGRAVAPVPALPALALAGLPIARFGSEAQRERWLRPLAAGEAVLTGAWTDAASDDPARPATVARRSGDEWVLDGARSAVPAAGAAQRIVVPAATEGSVGLFLVDPAAPGVTLTGSRTSTGEPLYELALDGARVADDDLLGGDVGGAAGAAVWAHECALVATCAVQVGVCERALEITTGYVSEREQFGAPLGTLQAVQHRAADCYIDLQSMRWTTWRAIYRLAEGLPAAREVLVAKFWAAEGGMRITAATQHLHGGMGVDLDYPIHRYFLWARSLEHAFGGAPPQLVRLGRELARTGPQEPA
ncbi:MAG: acyl-CoA dehydrogenase family protein [Myxococcota bacterium]|nr:acyl-CoA dehydrogenase family protein [Myxococcota bacterium]